MKNTLRLIASPFVLVVAFMGFVALLGYYAAKEILN